MTATSSTQDPSLIEEDIRRTQDEMSRTVDQIRQQFTPHNLINSLLDQAQNNNIEARTLIDGARRNPLALAMIAGGALWLVSDQDAKLPSRRKRAQEEQDDDLDTHYRGYVAHMNNVEWREGEDPASYQRRRDIARANYFMLERHDDEDDRGFRQRLSDATDRLRERTRAWSDQTQAAGASLSRSGGAAVSHVQNFYSTAPLIGGFVAAVAGAVLGGLLPSTKIEEEQLSDIGEKLRDAAAEQKEKLVSAVQDQKEQLIAKVEDHVGN